MRAVLPSCPSASMFAQTDPGRCHCLCWAHPQVIYILFQGALPTQDLCHSDQTCQWRAPAGTPALGHLVASHQNHWGHWGCSSWDLPATGKGGGSAFPHCGSTHLPSGSTGAQLARIYSMLNILICCSKVLWAGTWQSISKLKKRIIIKISSSNNNVTTTIISL